jgi:hypothetical protein
VGIEGDDRIPWTEVTHYERYDGKLQPLAACRLRAVSCTYFHCVALGSGDCGTLDAGAAALAQQQTVDSDVLSDLDTTDSQDSGDD